MNCLVNNLSAFKVYNDGLPPNGTSEIHSKKLLGIEVMLSNLKKKHCCIELNTDKKIFCLGPK